ncbi:MAG: Uncharacterized protein CEN90_76 [Parcubacteria group bacterium Licking1014_17]|nr:MAG: Uncharacterized protein CEN90_76 [Parcubacteria group bacterium Licking1014_17]
MSLIEVKNLTKIYREGDVETRAVDEINLKIEKGEFVAIIGPSGSGKSTLLQILGGLDRPTSGEYLFDDKDISRLPDNEVAHIRNRQMGFVFQAFNLLPRLTVIENVKLPLIYRGVDEPERTVIARKMIELVGLQDRENYKSVKLSGGQKQRVAIARALVNSPKVIFADEPTGSLDSKSGEVVLKYLEELNGEGNTIVMVTHESYVAKTAKRIIMLRDGKIESDEPVSERHSAFKDGLIK